MATGRTVIVFSVWMLLLTNIGCTKMYKSVPLSCKQIKQVVDAHNDCRARVAAGAVRGQPAAANMKYMIWDVELAEKASKYAAEGSFAHNPDRTIQSNRFITGENLYFFGTSTAGAVFNGTLAVDRWFEEHGNYAYGKMPSKPIDAGHYTQIVWADSVYVGCGLSAKEEGRKKSFLYVCNYGPPGNVVGLEPYKKASAAGKLQCGTENCDKKYGPKC